MGRPVDVYMPMEAADADADAAAFEAPRVFYAAPLVYDPPEFIASGLPTPPLFAEDYPSTSNFITASKPYCGMCRCFMNMHIESEILAGIRMDLHKELCIGSVPDIPRGFSIDG